MGRIAGETQQALADNEIVCRLRDMAMWVNDNIGGTRWYVFGSILGDAKIAADVDLLVVCNSDFDADLVRQAVDKFSVSKPVDLSILTEAEEAEICFVQNQRCVQIFPECA